MEFESTVYSVLESDGSIEVCASILIPEGYTPAFSSFLTVTSFNGSAGTGEQ